MQIPFVVNSENLITFLRPSLRGLNLKNGDVVRAEILNIMDAGFVSMRITKDSGESGIAVARSSISLSKGAVVFLKVSASESEIKLQFMGTATEGNKTTETHTENSLSQKILQMFSDMAGSRLNKKEVQLLGEFLKNIPYSIKASVPEFAVLERAMPEIEKISSDLLKKSIEESGILFETKLKLAVLEQQRSGDLEKILKIFTDPDRKMELIKLKTVLSDERVVNVLKNAGFSTSEIESAVEKLIKHLEFFQISSKANNVLFTFLPFSWHELKEGELTFRRKIEHNSESYTCDINLDLEPLGRLTVSVTLFEGVYYMSFYTEDELFKTIITNEKGILQKKFVEAGMPVGIINVVKKEKVNFGVPNAQGLNIKI